MPDALSALVVRAGFGGEYQSVASSPIIEEWLGLPAHPGVIRYFNRHGASLPLLARWAEQVARSSRLVVPTGDAPECRDEKDRKYLHCAVAADADYLVTTDLDMLVLETVGRTQIVRPGHLWRILSE